MGSAEYPKKKQAQNHQGTFWVVTWNIPSSQQRPLSKSRTDTAKTTHSDLLDLDLLASSPLPLWHFVPACLAALLVCCRCAVLPLSFTLLCFSFFLFSHALSAVSCSATSSDICRHRANSGEERHIECEGSFVALQSWWVLKALDCLCGPQLRLVFTD